jgi:hypothetical protein
MRRCDEVEDAERRTDDSEDDADEMVDIASLGARFFGFINRSIPDRTSLETEEGIV